MQRNRFKRVVASFCCLLLLGALLLLAGCGGSNPSSPNGTPKPGGYSLISILEKELPHLLAP